VSDGLEVRGGLGGTAVLVSAVSGCGDAVAECAARTALDAALLGRLLAEPGLAVTSALDPLGGARAADDAAGAAAALVLSATTLVRLASALQLAATTYLAADEGVRAEVARLATHAAAEALGPVALPAAVVGTGVVVTLSATAWAVVRSAPVALVASARTARAAARRELDGDEVTRIWSGAAVEVGDRLAADAVEVSLDAQALLARHPWAARQLLAALAGGADGLVPDRFEPLLPSVPVPGGVVDPAPGSVAGLAGLVAALAPVAGRGRQGTVSVTPLPAARAATAVRPAAGVADLAARLGPYAPPVDGRPDEGYRPGRVRLDRVEGAGGTRWVLYVPPTQTWSDTGGPLPADGTANVRMVGGLDSDALEAVRAVLDAAGVGADEPVLAVGYSQGGITAASLAADPRWSVEAVLALGAPVSALPVPDDVTVLAVESSSDLVPHVDGARDPDRASWTTVTADVPVDPDDPWAAHHLDAYRHHAALVDSSTHPSLVGWRQAVAPFLDPGARVSTQEYSTVRTLP
jgi:hypothetical protein